MQCDYKVQELEFSAIEFFLCIYLPFIFKMGLIAILYSPKNMNPLILNIDWLVGHRCVLEIDEYTVTLLLFVFGRFCKKRKRKRNKKN